MTPWGRWAALALTPILLGACATLSPSPFRPTIPPRPALEVPIPIPCPEPPAVTLPRRCWILPDEDLRALVRWGLGLERELQAACIALGHSPEVCRLPEDSPHAD